MFGASAFIERRVRRARFDQALIDDEHPTPGARATRRARNRRESRRPSDDDKESRRLTRRRRAREHPSVRDGAARGDGVGADRRRRAGRVRTPDATRRARVAVRAAKGAATDREVLRGRRAALDDVREGDGEIVEPRAGAADGDGGAASDEGRRAARGGARRGEGVHGGDFRERTRRGERRGDEDGGRARDGRVRGWTRRAGGGERRGGRVSNDAAEDDEAGNVGRPVGGRAQVHAEAARRGE